MFNINQLNNKYKPGIYIIQIDNNICKVLRCNEINSKISISNIKN